MFLNSHKNVTNIVFILIFSYGCLANNFVLLAENQKHIIRPIDLRQSDGKYTHLCFSTNSKKLSAVDPSQGTLHTWDLASARHISQLSINRPVQLYQIVPLDEKIILIADAKGIIWNLNLEKKKLSLLYKPPSDASDPLYIQSMVFDHKNSQLILIRGNGSVEYLGYQEEQITKTSRVNLMYDVRCAAFSNDFANIATADWDDNVNILLMSDSKPIRKIKFEENIYDLSFGLTKDLLVVSQDDGTCWGINTKLSQVKWKISCRSRLFKTRVSQDEKHIYALVGSIRKIRSKTGFAAFHIHRISDGQLVYSQKLKGDMPNALEVSPDGKFIATLSEGKINLWEIESDSSVNQHETDGETNRPK